MTLRPLDVSDYSLLRQLELSGSALENYRHRGVTPSPDRFVQSLWQDVLVNFAVCFSGDGALLGNAACYMPDFRNGTAHISVFLVEGARRQNFTSAFEAFIGYLFDTFPFRKLYLDVLEPNLRQFASGEGRIFQREATFLDDVFLGGEYVDRVVLAIWRDVWESTTGGAEPQRRSYGLGRALRDFR